VDEGEALDDLRLERLTGLVGIDRLVLGGVILEDAAQIGEQRDEPEVAHEQAHADQPLVDDEPAAAADRELVGDQRRTDLEHRDREADRDCEGEDEGATRELGVDLTVLPFLPRGVVRRDGERAEADGERLAEGHHAAHDRQPEDDVARHRRVDRARDLRDLSRRRTDGDGPVAGAAHHHALEDRLSADVCHGSPVLAATCLVGALQAALEALDATARVHELLLARVERVALRADLDVQLGLRRAGLERVPTGARHRGEDVLGMDAVFHCLLKIAAACAGSTLPPETITATPRPASTLPASTAPAAAAAAGSHASFARSYRKRIPSAISSSVTSTVSTRPRQISIGSSPANGGASPSAIVSVSTRTLWPAARPAGKACARSGAIPMMRAPPSSAVTMPEIRPPPPVPTTTVSRSGTSSSSSSASVPWPATTSGSECGWTKTRPSCSATPSERSYAAAASGGERSTVAPYPRVASTFGGLTPAHIWTRQSTPSSAAAHATAWA